MTKLINDTVMESDDLSAYGAARSTIHGTPLTADELRKMDAYFRASLYLNLGMIYLRSKPPQLNRLFAPMHPACA